jgi:hypothetical protein
MICISSFRDLHPNAAPRGRRIQPEKIGWRLFPLCCSVYPMTSSHHFLDHPGLAPMDGIAGSC